MDFLKNIGIVIGLLAGCFAINNGSGCLELTLRWYKLLILL